jgi:FixJ family two-component response regulator
MREPPLIAIVDDDSSLRRSLVRVLESAGYGVTAFSNGHEFLAWLSSSRPACLVLDVHLMDMNGFDVRDQVAIPVIFITAHDDAVTRERISRSAAAGYLPKPFGAATLLDAVRSALARR